MQSKTHTRPTCFFMSTLELTSMNMLSASQLRIIYFFQIFKELLSAKANIEANRLEYGFLLPLTTIH
jgi:hypothetical protein